MCVGYYNIRREGSVVWVLDRHHRALLGGEFVDFRGRNSVIELVDDFDDEGCIIHAGDTGFLTEHL